MQIPRLIVTVFSASLMMLGAGVVSGQTTSTGSGQAFPNKPIRIVSSEAGGGGDFAARLIASAMSDPLGQRMIVDNRASVLPGEIVAKAPPDGYTLLVEGFGFLIGPLLQEMPYDPVRDFSPISMLIRSPNVLVIHPSVPANSVSELIALAKSKPGGLNYGSASTGTPSHLAAELFKSMAGVNIVRIPYKGGGPAVSALVAGEVQLAIPSAPAATPHIKSGRLRALAVTTAQPSALLPGLPTVAAAGLPGYEASAPQSAFAPAKTPDAVIKRLNQEIVRVLNQADVKEKIFNAGTEAVGNSPEQFTAIIKSDMARMSKLIKDAGIRAN